MLSKHQLTSLRAGSYEIDNVLVFSNSLHHFHFWDKIGKFVICGVLWNKSIDIKVSNVKYQFSTLIGIQLHFYGVNTETKLVHLDIMKIFSLSASLSPIRSISLTIRRLVRQLDRQKTINSSTHLLVWLHVSRPFTRQNKKSVNKLVCCMLCVLTTLDKIWDFHKMFLLLFY